MKQKRENRVALLLHWAGEQKVWLFLAIFLSAVSGLCTVSYTHLTLPTT